MGHSESKWVQESPVGPTALLVQGYNAHPAEDAVKKSEEDGALLWAVLVAGSNSYENYRHQADICHAYQIMKRHGIPDERIIVMMYDDIASNEENPVKGTIINHPNGPNVYPGVLKDYTGEDVNPSNFLNVLKGNAAGIHKKGTKKVLKSGPNDHVFVYFADHGGPNIIAFPVELFTKIVTVYATTASNAEESSYATYWSDKFQVYLGDVYSVKWMEDTDKENIQKETLLHQFEVVKKETNTSHVQEFGDLTISKAPVGQFQGMKKAEQITVPEYVATAENSVNSRDVPIFTRMHNLDKAKTIDEKLEILEDLKNMIEKRVTLVKNMKNIYNQVIEATLYDGSYVTKVPEIEESENCYYTAVDEYNSKCYNVALNTFSLGYLEQIKNLCDAGLRTNLILEKINDNCRGASVTGTV
ncbi:Legumain [Nymphon striatum]|nr:Legumain [Nymphon striatum]